MLVESVPVLLGTLLIYFIPGVIWSYVFFDHGEEFGWGNESRLVRFIERMALSMALSLVLVSLTTFALNPLIVIGSSLTSALIVSVTPASIGLILYFLKRKGAFALFTKNKS